MFWSAFIYMQQTYKADNNFKTCYWQDKGYSYVYTEDSRLLVVFLSQYIEGLDMVPGTGSSLSPCCRYTVDSCLQDVQKSDHRGHVDLRKHNLKDRINQGLSNLLAEMLLLSVDILTFIRVPTEIQKHNSKIFPWFSIINNVISMTIKCTASNLPFKQHLHHIEHKCGMQH